MKIDEMLAGRELDALVGEKVMGGKWIRFKDANYPDPDEQDGRVHAFLVIPKKDLDSFISGNLSHDNYVLDTGECKRDRVSWVPNYSTDIGEAWKVVEKMKLSLMPTNTGWSVSQHHLWEGPFGEGATAPLAICRAALNSVMHLKTIGI